MATARPVYNVCLSIGMVCLLAWYGMATSMVWYGMVWLLVVSVYCLSLNSSVSWLPYCLSLVASQTYIWVWNFILPF